MNAIQIALSAQSFINEAKAYNLDLNYSLESLEKVEDYLRKTMPKPAMPIAKSLFADDMQIKTIGFGAYIGEIVRRKASHAKWNYEEGNSPWEIALIQPNGNTGFPINKAFKRVNNGEEDNTHHFARVFLTKIFDKDLELTEGFFTDVDSRLAKYGDSPITYYSNNITENGGIINHVNQSRGSWLFSYGQETEDDFDLLFLDEVKELHPDISDLLEESERSRIEKEADGSYRKQEAYKGMFFDSNSQASFQGNMKPNYIQWIKMNIGKVMRITIYPIISCWLMLNIHWSLGLIFIGTLLYNLWYWSGVKGKFGGGDVNVGKVLSLSPDTVAVATDMTKMIGSYPLLKIIKTKIPKEDREVGKYIPTVATYNDNPHDYPFWSEFHPVPVSHGIKNMEQRNYLMSKFTDDDLKQLNEFIEKAGSTEVKSYKINEVESGWKDYSHVDINKGVSMEGPIGE